MALRGSRLSFAYLAVLVAGSPLYFAVSGMSQRVLFYVYGFSAVTGILIGVRLHRPEHRGPWFAFAGGLLLFALGDVAFDLYAIHGVAPVPSVADVLYLAGYPVLAFGMLLLVRYRVPGRDVVSALDGAIITIGVGIIGWVFVVSPYAGRPELGLATRLVSIAYPMFDLLLLAVVVRLLLSGGRRSVAYRFVAMSVLALLITDGVYTVATMHDTYNDGSIIDVGWMLSYALFGAAALHPSMHVVTTWKSSSSARPPVRAVLTVLAVAALSPIALLIFEHEYRSNKDITAIAVCSAAILVLVFARVGALTRALNRAFGAVARGARRQEVLTKAALAMVTADDMQAVADATVRAAVSSASLGDAWSVFVVSDAEGLRIVAAAGTNAPDAVHADILSLWDRNEVFTRPLLVLDADESSGASARFVAPVTVAMLMRALVVVGNVSIAADEFAPALAVLSSETALALQAIDRTEERHRTRTEQLFGAVMQQSSDVITLVGADQVIRSQSPGVANVLGVPADTYVGWPLAEFVHPDDVATSRAELAKILKAGPGSTGRLEVRARHGDGTWRDVDTVVTNLLGAPDVDAIVLNSRDVTERRDLERELHDQALHDALTELPNRTLFLDRVAHALSRVGRGAQTIAVVFADLDDFQVVNNSLGHTVGDQLLKGVAERLRQAVRPGDTVARLGGDEFAILLEDGDASVAAEIVAQRVAASLLPSIDLDATSVSIRASLGIALGVPGQQSAGELLRNADLAMSMAKRNGKERYELFSPSMHEDAVQRLVVAADLRDALTRDELEVFYQPIVDIRTGSLAGAEALVRWNHPRRGFVGPDQFVPVAEATGLIVPLDRFVLVQACKQTQSWRAQHLVDDHFYISVNLSGRQIQDQSIVDDVGLALRGSELPAKALVLEVTESSVMGDVDRAIARLRELKALGLRLAIDDFGTGFSSLSYLSNLPVDLVKIDKSFIDRLTDGHDGQAMVRVVLDLSRTLGLTVIAEGIETEAQLNLLAAMGCGRAQGYLLAKPMPAPDMTRLLERVSHGQPLHRPIPLLTDAHA